MLAHDIKSFIGIVTRYFEEVSGIAAEIGLPYLKDKDEILKDFTGIIGISGSRKGGIYLTADQALLKDFAKAILQEEEIEAEYIFDLAGEMVNTIAGNIREFFGSQFLISIPIVVEGHIKNIELKLKPPVFIIPISWKGHRCHLAIGLE